MTRALLALILLLSAVPAPADDPVPPSFDTRTSGAHLQEGRMPTLEPFDRVPLVSRLEPSAEVARKALSTLQDDNAHHRGALRNGFRRHLGRPVAVSFGAAPERGLTRSIGDALIWTGRFEVRNAWGVRLHLTDVAVGLGVEIWISDGEREVGPLDLSRLLYDGEIWCPTVFGPLVQLTVKVPAEASSGTRFTIAEVMELVSLEPEMSALDWTDCAVNGECVTSSTFDQIDGLRSAVAPLFFTRDGEGYVCTGTLLNDTDPAGFIPYVLTANHCFSTQSAASSVEAYWDWRYSSCSSSAVPAYGEVTYGATLLATGSESDFTFVRLGRSPAGRYYAGWDPRLSAVQPGTEIHLLAHSEGRPQVYSRATIYSPSSTCSEAPAGRFLYSRVEIGSQSGGASGGAAVLTGGYVVGQLFGACYTPGYDDCLYSSYDQVFGAFHQTYASIAQWLRPESCSTPSAPSVSVPAAARTGANYTVSWSATSRDNRYEIEESPDPAFTTSSRFEVTGTSRLFSHQVSTSTSFHYRVRAVENCGSQNWLSPWSAAGQITISADSPPNCSTVGTIPCGAVVSGSLVPGDCPWGGDYRSDLYQIFARRNEPTVISLSGSVPVYLEIFDIDQSFGTWSGGSRYETLTFTPPETGNYWLLVSTWDENQSGNYTIARSCGRIVVCSVIPWASGGEGSRLQASGAAVSPPASRLRPRERERSPAVRNVSAAQADPCSQSLPLSCDRTIGGELASGDCRFEDGTWGDWYSLMPTPGRWMEVHISALVDVWVQISEQDGRRGSWTVVPSGGSGRLAFLALLPGEHWALVNALSPGGSGSYSVGMICEVEPTCLDHRRTVRR